MDVKISMSVGDNHIVNPLSLFLLFSLHNRAVLGVDSCIRQGSVCLLENMEDSVSNPTIAVIKSYKIE